MEQLIYKQRFYSTYKAHKQALIRFIKSLYWVQILKFHTLHLLLRLKIKCKDYMNE